MNPHVASTSDKTATLQRLGLLTAALAWTCACAPVDQQMKRAVADERCEKAARIGHQWLSKELPQRLKKSKSPDKLRQTAKLHADVVLHMLKALHCAATQRNTIAALKSYREVSDRLVKPIAQAYAGKVVAEKKRLDDEALGQEATIHYFQYVKPRNTAAAYRLHRKLYPTSRYLKDSLKSELQMALHEAWEQPRYETTAAFAKNYAEVRGGKERIGELWRRTAMAEFRAITRQEEPTVAQFATWFQRYSQHVPASDLQTVGNYMRSVVTSQVAALSKSTDVRELLAFVQATRDIKLPESMADLQRALELRRLVVQRQLLELTRKHAMKRGTAEAYEGFVAMWAEDPTAAELVEKVRKALALRVAWLELGSNPSVADVGEFLTEHGPALVGEEVQSLQGCPTVADALRRGRQIGKGDECALKALIQTCLDAKWCDMKQPAVQAVVGELARAVQRANRGGRSVKCP